MAWPLAAVVCVALGAGATRLLRRMRLPREETAAGIAALAGMRWRDFMHLVLAAMNQRGYERVFEPGAGGNESDFLLERDGQRWLLSCKHGMAYVLGSTSIAEFAREMRMRGATGGLLVTPGRFADEAHALANAQRIELLDGPALWPEVKRLLPPEEREHILAPTLATSRRETGFAWAGAIATGLLVGLLLQRLAPREPEAAVATAAHRAPVPVAPAIAAPAIPTDPVELQRRRQDVATAVSTVRGVDKALWTTHSTLLVYLAQDLPDPMGDICPLLERYDELAASRVQLQPPAGSERPVRFRQCRAY
jgi:hypothetical protein